MYDSTNKFFADFEDIETYFDEDLYWYLKQEEPLEEYVDDRSVLQREVPDL